MTTGLTGRQIRDKTIDGDDLKDSVTVNPGGTAGGGLYVRGTGGYLLSASAGAAAVAFSGSVSLDGGLTAAGDVLEVTGTIVATGGVSGSLTRLADGSTYLRAGSGISIVSGSDGSVTVSSTGSMPDLSYILLNNAGPVFENERILTAGTGITITDAGPKGSVTISASGPAPGGWTTGYEVDFTALPSTGAKLGDGGQTIDGKPWYVLNSSNATELQIVNGVGLSIRATSGYFGTTYYGDHYRTAPLITSKLSDLTGGVKWSEVSAFRVSSIVSWEFEIVGHSLFTVLENYLASGGASVISSMRAANGRWYVQWFSSSAIQEVSTGTSDACDVTEIETSCLYPWVARFNAYPSAGGNFPANPDRVYLGSINTVAAPVSLTTQPSVIQNQTAMAFTFTATNPSFGTMRAVLKRLRVEYR